MSLPDFMSESYTKLKRINDSFTRLDKIIKIDMYFIRYLSIVLYATLKAKKVKTSKADQVILKYFHGPTDGVWLNLLRETLYTKNQNTDLVEVLSKKKLSKAQSERFYSMFALLIQNNEYNSKELTYYDTLNYILKIKNLKISHGAFDPEKVDIISKTLVETTEEIIEGLKNLFNYPIAKVDFNSNDEMYISHINGTIDESLFDKFYEEDGLYIIIEGEIVSLMPFITCRDGEVLFYDTFERKRGKVNYSNNEGVRRYIKRDHQKISSLLNIDVDAVNLQPLYLNSQESENGTIHNLPSKGYNTFIGRQSELEELNNKVSHKRNYITALDGIGGVGKSAIALEYCSNLIQSERKKVDYIFWVSAKTTMLINGKIENIKQSFVHLDQLLDLILDMTRFGEYKTFDNEQKKNMVLQILELVDSLIVLDNLETISERNLIDIWNFINDIPTPNKVLLTSREMHYNAHQEVRIKNLSRADSLEFLREYCISMEFSNSLYKNIENDIVDISSGLPIAIKSIIGQIVLGRNFKSIKKSIIKNSDNLAEFCFKEQLDLLDKDHYKILLYICFSIEALDFDAIEYLIDEIDSVEITPLLDKLISLSIIYLEDVGDKRVYSTLPLIKKYIVNSIRDIELVESVKKTLNDFYNLADVESFNLFPVEQRNIKQADFIPKKIIDNAMKHAQNDELEEADNWFKKALNLFEEDEYVLFTYAQYLAKYKNKIQESINYLKQVNSLSPNYIYLKKIGDHHSKLYNYDVAIKYYENAKKSAQSQQDKDEMTYNIALTTFKKVKRFRKENNKNRTPDFFEKRNLYYGDVVAHLERYLDVQPRIYIGKKVNIHRMLAEAYYGIKKYDEALKNIDYAIQYSEGDTAHKEYKKIIEEGMKRIYKNVLK